MSETAPLAATALRDRDGWPPGEAAFTVDPVSALKVAMTQARARIAAEAVIAEIGEMFGEMEVKLTAFLEDARAKAEQIVRAQLLDACLDEPFDLLASPHSAVSPDVPEVDDEDERAIDAMYGAGFGSYLADLARLARERQLDGAAQLAGTLEDLLKAMERVERAVTSGTAP